MAKRRLLLLIASLSLLTACGGTSEGLVSVPSSTDTSTTTIETDSTTLSDTEVKEKRDNTPLCLEPTAPGTLTTGNEYATVDYSNATEGYIMVDYLGSVSKVKLQLTGPNSVTYTYDLTNGYAAFPLTSGDGDYTVSVCENIEGTKYALSFTTTLSFSGISEFGPYLYPNRYVNFNSSLKTIEKAKELADNCYSDLDVVSNVYNYVIDNITYDYDKANSVKSGYISSVDEILESGTGICLDYSCVMTSMLRSERIPTRLEVGYVGEDMLYHAWISVYLKDVGWVNGIIQFNGYEWSLMDPTFGASTSDETLKEYIGTGDNYSVKYVY